MADTFKKYGLVWNADEYDDAQVERHMLQQGGKWTDAKGRTFGNGLIFHFKQYWSLLWPEDSQNEWTDLILENVIKHQFTSLVGPASAWKSGTVSRIALMDWSCFPDCTSVLMSSTDMEGLRSRIYGETTLMWKHASEKYEWFPGFPVDSRCVITHTNVEEERARDIRNSIVGIPCKTSTGTFIGMGKYSFLPSQLVDTPSGRVPIGNIKPGDMVFSAIGQSRVESVSNRISETVIRLSLSDGNSIDCTPEHPFLTSSGWVKAVDLLPHHRLISPDETLSILQDSDAGMLPHSEILLQGVRNGLLYQKLQGVRQEVYSERRERNFLHALLRVELENETAQNCRANDFWERFGESWSQYKHWHPRQPQRNETPTRLYVIPKESSYLERRTHSTNRSGKSLTELFSGIPMGAGCENWTQRKMRLSGILQAGCRMAEAEIRCRSGWQNPRFNFPTQEGLKTHSISTAPRVVRVAFYKPGDKISAFKSDGGYRVCNIEVKGHPSYVVNNCLVHNSGRKNRRVWCLSDEFQFMQLSVLQAQDNLISNDDGTAGFGGFYPEDYQDPRERGKPRRHYRCVFIGNTNPSVRDNPLDIVSEPEFGWGSVFEPTITEGRTQVWKCKKHPKHPVQCYCINLDSMDSPNSKFPVDRPRWAHMAGPHKAKTYTEGSESYWSNGRGVFKFGLDAFKIITREICDQFHAFDPITTTPWDGDTVKIGACDASYGVVGGDRCILIWIEFGRCTDGKVRILVNPYWTVPVAIRKDKIPEDQIADFCKEQMESVGVLPENFFFDGRGSLAMSYARIWSPAVNSIEFGGVPTDRPAGPDLYTIDDKTQQRRAQTARERFNKFVSELWWSWRYVVESDQMRGVQMEVVLDAQPREWKKVAHDKIEVESKRDLKKRTSCSPDLADALVTAIEGARRRGFVISNLAPKEKQKDTTPSWLDDMYSEHLDDIASKQLASA